MSKIGDILQEWGFLKGGKAPPHDHPVHPKQPQDLPSHCASCGRSVTAIRSFHHEGKDYCSDCYHKKGFDKQHEWSEYNFVIVEDATHGYVLSDHVVFQSHNQRIGTMKETKMSKVLNEAAYKQPTENDIGVLKNYLSRIERVYGDLKRFRPEGTGDLIPGTVANVLASLEDAVEELKTEVSYLTRTRENPWHGGR